LTIKMVPKPNFRQYQMLMRYYQILNGEGFTMLKALKGFRHMTNGKATNSSMVGILSNTFSTEASTNNGSRFQTYSGTQMFWNLTYETLVCFTKDRKFGFFIFTTPNCQSANRQSRSLLL
jgi:hypothetical protein